jgi:beta-galactosidase
MPSQSVRYLEQVHAAYEALRRTGVTVDIVRGDDDISGYAVVVAPCLHLVSDAEAANLEAFVAAGGTALVTFFSGVVDESDRVRIGEAAGPGAFSGLLGAWTEEYLPLLPPETVFLSSGAAAHTWTERLRPTTAAVVESFVDGPVAGSPAVTRNELGTGTAWYVATQLAEPDFEALARRVLTEAGVATTHVGPDVEVVTRESATAAYTFIINHSASAVTLEVGGTELLTGEPVAGSIEVAPGLVRVVRTRKDNS